MAKKHGRTESEHSHQPPPPPPPPPQQKKKSGKKKMKKGRDDSNELEPKKKLKKKKELRPTVSIALPGSIIDNAQTLYLATRLASQVARAATIFRIEEVVVFDSKGTPGNGSTDGVKDGVDDYESGAAFLVRILRYLETPQYLRKSLFPKHNVMRYVGRHVFSTLFWVLTRHVVEFFPKLLKEDDNEISNAVAVSQ